MLLIILAVHSNIIVKCIAMTIPNTSLNDEFINTVKLVFAFTTPNTKYRDIPVMAIMMIFFKILLFTSLIFQ